MPTTRNAKGIDILIYSQDGARKLSIQVKALSKRDPVPLGGSLNNLFADYVIVCRDVIKEPPECYVLNSGEVRKHAHRAVKDGKVSYWLQPHDYESDDFREKWDRIGTGT